MSKTVIEELSTSYTPFCTRALKGKMDSTLLELDKRMKVDDGTIFKIEDNIIFLKGELPDVPVFHHPLVSNEGTAYIDVRGFINRSGELSNVFELKFLVQRAKLDLLWKKDWESFSLQSGIVIDTFCNWFSNGLSIRLNLDKVTGVRLKVLAAVYYLGRLEREEVNLDEKTLEGVRIKLLRSIPMITRMPAQLVDEVIMKNLKAVVSLYRVEYDEDIDDNKDKLFAFSLLITEYLDNIVKVKPEIIYNSLCSGSFISSNSIENVAVAMQHPPLFYLMIYKTLAKGAQSKTHIGRAALGVKGRNDTSQFNKFIEKIID